MSPEPMKNRVVRAPDALWDAFKAAAERKGETPSAVLRRAMERYAKR